MAYHQSRLEEPVIYFSSNMSDSDNDDDGYFDYNSSQNYYDIQYQIDLLEMRQSYKRDKYWKEKGGRSRSIYSISTRKLQGHTVLLKNNRKQCAQNSFDHQHNSSIPKRFECDEEFLMKLTYPKFKNPVNRKQMNFSSFRDRFYRKHHEKIKASLTNRSDIEIDNIRLAPISKSVESQFMIRLKQNRSSAPQLVYHGTQTKNMESILRFGFLVPNQAHPSIKHAPIIQSLNGQAYGPGIYCSRKASYSTWYGRGTNTLLVCAAIPNYNQMGKIQCFGNILVLPHVSQIIPLFLMDFSYVNRQNCDCHQCRLYTQSQTDNMPIGQQPMLVAKGFLRKILSYVNNRTRKSERYQVRLFDQFNK
jgi:hypothetical protein